MVIDSSIQKQILKVVCFGSFIFKSELNKTIKITINKAIVLKVRFEDRVLPPIYPIFFKKILQT